MAIDFNALKSAGWQGSSIPSGATSYTKNSDGSFTFQINGKDVKYNASGSVFEASSATSGNAPAASASGNAAPFYIASPSIFGGGFGVENFDLGAMSLMSSMSDYSSPATSSWFNSFPSINMFSMIQQLMSSIQIPFISSNGSQRVDGVTGASTRVDGSNNKASGVLSSDMKQYGVREMTLPDGSKVLGCRWTRFDKCQPEWLDKQKYLQQAAKELGLTLLYSDVERTVAESNAGRARKGALVCRGGESPHNYGTAADIVLYKDGKAVGVDSDLQTRFAQRVKELSGGTVTWGGDWKKKGERHHFELTNWRRYKDQSHLVG